jgi:hypothetical protein
MFAFINYFNPNNMAVPAGGGGGVMKSHKEGPIFLE